MNPLIDPTPRGNQNSTTQFGRELDAARSKLRWARLLDTLIEIREAAIRDGYEPTASPGAQLLIRGLCRRPVSLHCLDGSVLIVDADRYMNLGAQA